MNVKHWLVLSLVVTGCSGASTGSPGTTPAATPAATPADAGTPPPSTSALPDVPLHGEFGGTAVNGGTLNLKSFQGGTWAIDYENEMVILSLALPSAPAPDAPITDAEVSQAGAIYTDVSGANQTAASTFTVSLQIDGALPSCPAERAAEWTDAGPVTGLVSAHITDTRSGARSFLEGRFEGQVRCAPPL